MKTNTLNNESELISRLKSGNESAFQFIYESNFEDVYAICYRATHDRDFSADSVQDIFQSLWQRRQTLEISGSIKGYLCKAAKNLVYKHYRDQQIHSRNLDCFFTDYCGQENCTENQVLYHELEDRLGRLIDQLPCNCKTVFELSRDRQMTHAQISEKTGLSIKMVEYHITNARKFIARGLGEYLPLLFLLHHVLITHLFTETYKPTTFSIQENLIFFITIV